MAPPKAIRKKPSFSSRSCLPKKEPSTGVPPAKYNPSKRQAVNSLSKAHKARENERHRARARKREDQAFQNDQFVSSLETRTGANMATVPELTADLKLTPKSTSPTLKRKMVVLKWGLLISASQS